MAQHDQNIANALFPDVRGDINDALAALFSSNSGATAPSTTVAYQPWGDTANSVLKIRNAADSAWIAMGYLNQSSGQWEAHANVIQALTTAGIQFKNSSGTNTILISDAGLFDGRDIAADGADLDQHDDVIRNAFDAALTTGTTTAYLFAALKTVTTLSQGEMWLVRPHADNTGAATLKIDGTTAANWKHRNSAGTLVTYAAGEIRLGQVHLVVWGGANFITIGRLDNWASTAEAEAGTKIALMMDPKLTKEAIDAQVPVIIAATPDNSGLVFIETQNFSGDATADFTGFNATLYDSYVFELENVIPATDNVDLLIRTSTDGGTSYDSDALYDWGCNFATETGALDTDGGSGGTNIQLNATTRLGSDTSQHGMSGTVDIHGPHKAKRTFITTRLAYTSTAGAGYFGGGGGLRLVAADVDALQFFFSLGNLESGTITMYGRVNS